MEICRHTVRFESHNSDVSRFRENCAFFFLFMVCSLCRVMGQNEGSTETSVTIFFFFCLQHIHTTKPLVYSSAGGSTKIQMGTRVKFLNVSGFRNR